MFDGKAFGQEIVEAVKGHIERVVLPLEQRLAALESRPPEKGEKGDPGPRGFRGEDGRDGKDGRDGVDGFGFDDLDVAYDGERSFMLRFTQSDRVKEFPFQIPAMIYRGAWSADESYGQGDTVMCGGSLWICTAATANKPDEGAAGWDRAARRGRDGKNGKDGERGEKGDRGAEGRAGRDLTQTAPDGSKW